MGNAKDLDHQPSTTQVATGPGLHRVLSRAPAALHVGAGSPFDHMEFRV